jgi:hypothetical protein
MLSSDDACLTMVSDCMSIPSLLSLGFSLSAACKEHHWAVLALLVSSDNSPMLADNAKTSEIKIKNQKRK